MCMNKKLQSALLVALVSAVPTAVGQRYVEDPRQGPDTLLGCVSGGNLQPVLQPFVLEPAEPWVLVQVVRRDQRDGSLRLVAVPTEYRITGIDMTPWLGMRVRVEGEITAESGSPEINAHRVTSIWGTCPSPAGWTPVASP
jgi:hypothetical protein